MRNPIVRHDFLRLFFGGLFFGAPAAAAARKEERVPTDLEAMNAFAEEYNRYASKLQNGEIDVKQWKRTAQAWRQMQMGA